MSDERYRDDAKCPYCGQSECKHEVVFHARDNHDWYGRLPDATKEADQKLRRALWHFLASKAGRMRATSDAMTRLIERATEYFDPKSVDSCDHVPTWDYWLALAESVRESSVVVVKWDNGAPAGNDTFVHVYFAKPEVGIRRVASLALQDLAVQPIERQKEVAGGPEGYGMTASERSEIRCSSCERTQSGTDWCKRCGALLSGNGYRVVGTLSQTPVGRVYRAMGSKNVEVALKEISFATALDARTIDRFEREAEVLRQLSHPQIPRFVAAFKLVRDTETRLYLAQQYIQGEDLDRRFEQHRFDEREAWQIALEVLGVLHYLHTRSPQILHRDIKPSNIIKAKDGRHHVVDFGAAKDLRLSVQTSVAGTFGYMAPEQTFGRAEARSDLYGLGMTLARLLSRREPAELIAPDNRGVVIAPHVNASEPFVRFLERLLSHSPGDRFSTARAAGVELRKIDSSPPRRRQSANLGSSPVARTGTFPAVVGRAAQQRAAMPKPRGGPRAPTGAPDTRIMSVASAQFHWLVSKRGLTASAYGARAWGLDFGTKILGLRPGHEYTVGRDLAADIVIPEDWPGADSVSRLHALLVPRANGLVVKDLGSSNGTRVGLLVVDARSDGVTIAQPAELQLGKIALAISPLGGADAS